MLHNSFRVDPRGAVAHSARVGLDHVGGGRRVAASGRLRYRISAVGDLDAATRTAMWNVFAAYYEDISRERFESDLQSKSHVILLVDRADGGIRGFSTQVLMRECVQGQDVLAVYSGDTIVDREYWGQRALHSGFARYLMQVKLAHPLTPMYWFLITKGYKTYLLLTRNFTRHWPRSERPTPPWESELLHRLAVSKFGAAWKPALGILHFNERLGRLREHIAPIDVALMQAPDIRFFVKRNPGHAQGDELCCLGRVDAGMLFRHVGKTLKKSLGGIFGGKARKSFGVMPGAGP